MLFSRTRVFEGFLLVYTISSLCLMVIYLNFQLAINASPSSTSLITQRGCFYLLGVAVGSVGTCAMFIMYYLQTDKIVPLIIATTSVLIELEIVFCLLINFGEFEAKVEHRETTLISTVSLTGYFVVLQSFGLICTWLHFRLGRSQRGNY